ncbi:sulfatase family protein [Luteolibacter pohnpeiensis]|uniref:sulfatase family protein n=1 Tax=Luteolibacter pohnpeiensis TaxID=454153 RepID=UPI001905EAEA|nr:sulfatase [Luteolibacter pohnpeiensis]
MQAIIRLAGGSGSMDNKFASLAKDEYMGFLIGQNLMLIPAYLLLAVAGALLVQPLASFWTKRSKFRAAWAVALRALLLTGIIDGYCTLRLVDTRPYFLHDNAFSNSYYGMLDVIPNAIRPQSFFQLFHVLPVLFLIGVGIWHIQRHGKRGWITAGALSLIVLGIFGYQEIGNLRKPTIESAHDAPNIIIIGSDSLRADQLGVGGNHPTRKDGLAAAGVSPVIDRLAEKSTRFENCYTPIASTLESGTSLMTSEYPQSHGLRQMYPNRQTVEKTQKSTIPLADVLKKKGYSTAAIGDWCAGYYHVMPLGFDDISVSSFDSFKIYMSQAVVMAHFEIPLYFDNPLGYKIFPQLGAFAEFVTPEVVTKRVEDRLADPAIHRKPFFWHVFYSCTHLPYRSQEPYCSMFGDPNYRGANQTGVDFDINTFIGGTDLESKWKALPPEEVSQIRSLYDGCTRQFDTCVGRILASLKANGLADNTIVIITADHGDDLYEPGVTLGHGLTFNGGLQANHIPMIVYVPGEPAKVIPESVRLIDVAPTIADLAGADKPKIWQGQSFAGWLHGHSPEAWRPFYGETGFPFIQFTVPGVERPKLPPMDELTKIDPDYNYQFVLKDQYLDRLIQAKQRCLRTQHWKIVCTPTSSGKRHFSLFNLTDDPFGEHELTEQRPEVLAPMQRALERWMDEKKESSIQEIFPAGEPS